MGILKAILGGASDWSASGIIHQFFGRKWDIILLSFIHSYRVDSIVPKNGYSHISPVNTSRKTLNEDYSCTFLKVADMVFVDNYFE